VHAFESTMQPEDFDSIEAPEEPEDPGMTFDADGRLDESLDDAAQGVQSTTEQSPIGTGEIDAIGEAAGLVSRDDKPFRGIDEVERRDLHRWELDPDSAEPGQRQLR